jgi:hypothetical protein
MEELKTELDCFGVLYEPKLVPCRDKCAVRFLCAEKCKKRLQEVGQEQFEQEKRSVIMAQEQEVRKSELEKAEKRSTVDPEVSPLISEVIALFTSMGLKTVKNRGYVAFKIENRSIFTINKMKAKKLDNIIKCIFTKNREEFPKEILPYLTEEKLGGYYCLTATTIKELEEVSKQYLEIFKG